MSEQVTRRSSCTSGRVRCEGVGAPIFTGVCYCADCQQGGRRIEALPHAKPVLDADGGTAYLTYRDDRFRCVSGSDLLVSYKLSERAPTQRLVASCCNTAMYLKFAPGHWTSAYRSRFEGDLPPLQARSQTQHRDYPLQIHTDAPNYRSYPPKLMVRLLGSRLAMLVGR